MVRFIRKDGSELTLKKDNECKDSGEQEGGGVSYVMKLDKLSYDCTTNLKGEENA